MLRISTKFLAGGLFMALAAALPAQRPVQVRNPGFEASFSRTFAMPGWAAWGKGASPDILPGQWDVRLPPHEGHTYLGLITREDGTRESVIQHLDHPLEAGRCYYFTIALARDSAYAGFPYPLALHVLGRSGKSGFPVRLVSSLLVNRTAWEIHTLEFTPQTRVDDLILEAAPGPGVRISYRGNLLLDAMSPISPCLRASR